MSAAKGNKYAAGANSGRPPVFETPEELSKKIDEYFIWKEADDGIITVSGLAFYLGFASRQSLQDYKEREEFSYTIKKAVLFIESCYEEKLSGTAPTGAIFALKNMGWKDKTETEHSGELTVKQITGMIVQ